MKRKYTIKICFVPSVTENDIHPPSPPKKKKKNTDFTQVSEDVVDKLIRNLPTKYGQLVPWPKFLFRDFSDILLHQLQSWSTH